MKFTVSWPAAAVLVVALAAIAVMALKNVPGASMGAMAAIALVVQSLSSPVASRSIMPPPMPGDSVAPKDEP